MTVTNLQCSTFVPILYLMLSRKLITLKEIFPLQHEVIAKLLESNGDLQSIVEDLLECHHILASKSTARNDSSVPKKYWEELYEDLKKEVIDLVARETNGS